MKQSAKVVVLSVLALFLFFTAIAMRSFGAPKKTAMDDYMILNGQRETAANNIVAAIVFDYRGYDTLGEATILFTAVSGVFLLFRAVKK
ncbi:MAG: hydrogen gas-evolving membrane-bound hydrogenase subunit E [Candidatus Diapherotrites archaeon]